MPHGCGVAGLIRRQACEEGEAIKSCPQNSLWEESRTESNHRENRQLKEVLGAEHPQVHGLPLVLLF